MVVKRKSKYKITLAFLLTGFLLSILYTGVILCAVISWRALLKIDLGVHGWSSCSLLLSFSAYKYVDNERKVKLVIMHDCMFNRIRGFHRKNIVITTIFTTTRLSFSKHFWALCNTLPSIIPYMGSVWCYRNWIELEGIKMARNYPVNLRWRVLHWLVRGFRVVDVARILHLRQIFVKKFRHFFRIKCPLGGLSYAADGKLAFNLVNKLNWSVK